MNNQLSLSESMKQTLEVSNLEFVGDFGEIAIDSIINEGFLRDVPLIGTLVGAGKCIKNIYDAHFAKNLIAFFIPLKDTTPEERAKAISKWENDENYRGKVGDTLIGMISRCDDAVKSVWLSKLFKELVLKHNYSRLFMRAEKILSSLSVMDVQAFLNRSRNVYSYIRARDVEPYVGSGLYNNPKFQEPIDGNLDLDDQNCEVTEVGYWIYNVLNDIPADEIKFYDLLSVE